MSSVNKAILIGNLGKDPEIRTFPNGGKVANFSVATSESWKDKATGEKKERTEWHRVAVFNEHLVKIAETYLTKGSKVYIEGQIETRKYEKDGRDVYTTEIVLRPFSGVITMLSGKGEKNETAHAAETHKGFDKQGDVAKPLDDLNDQIPF